ncbi:hypothetical protein ACFQ7F_34175 [Streptomyces sp. NPDC056486]|uniref:hypothetical protein n=1 Tax=Streptomyces sp. NPDC056486 TaxID=3345835 RepID=UPI0036A0EEB5
MGASRFRTVHTRFVHTCDGYGTKRTPWAATDDRAAIEKIAAGDPLVLAEVREDRISEFIATKTAPELAPYRHEVP